MAGEKIAHSLLGCYGPLKRDPLFMRFDELSHEAYRLYFALTGSHPQQFSTKNIYSMRMMYMAETASDSVRLLASHICTMSALSLCRDRYEYAARFSYLSYKKDDKEWFHYLVDYFYKQHKLGAWLERVPLLRQLYEERVTDTKKAHHYRQAEPASREFAQTWSRKKLDQLVKERDQLVRKMDDLPHFLKYQYYPLYAGIYVEYSSITHMDLHALSLIKVHKLSGGMRILAPDRIWPWAIVSQCAILDVLQCAECVRNFYGHMHLDDFGSLYEEWKAATEQLKGRTTERPQNAKGQRD